MKKLIGILFILFSILWWITYSNNWFDAWYERAERYQINDTIDCYTDSFDFIQWCEAYVEDYKIDNEIHYNTEDDSDDLSRLRGILLLCLWIASWPLLSSLLESIMRGSKKWHWYVEHSNDIEGIWWLIIYWWPIFFLISFGIISVITEKDNMLWTWTTILTIVFIIIIIIVAPISEKREKKKEDKREKKRLSKSWYPDHEDDYY